VRSLLLDQREVIKQKRGGGGGYGNAGAAGMVVAAEVVEKSPMAVLTELRALLDAGLITSEDYETKKKNVVAAMR
jgi:predicted transcriptional regulator